MPFETKSDSAARRTDTAETKISSVLLFNQRITSLPIADSISLIFELFDDLPTGNLAGGRSACYRCHSSLSLLRQTLMTKKQRLQALKQHLAKVVTDIAIPCILTWPADGGAKGREKDNKERHSARRPHKKHQKLLLPSSSI